MSTQPVLRSRRENGREEDSHVQYLPTQQALCTVVGETHVEGILVMGRELKGSGKRGSKGLIRENS